MTDANVGGLDAKELNSETPPGYWVDQFKGMPESIVGPPYIRFLQGSLMLRKAVTLFQLVEIEALEGNQRLSTVLSDFERSKEAIQLRLTYQTFYASHLLISLVSEVEHFFGSAVSAALRIYPGKMGGQTFKLLDILAVDSTDELIDRAANAYLNDLMYEKPLDYIKKLCSVLSIDVALIEPYWPKFVELKARRDLGVHNNWVANEIYLRKLKEANIEITRGVGDHVIPDHNYLIEAMKSCSELVDVMANLLAEKWIRP